MKQKEFVYRNIEEALGELRAQDKGRYFLCTCPECQHHEAFIYKNNLSFIQCNRGNHCGERMILHFEEKDNMMSFYPQEESYPDLSTEQRKALFGTTKLFQYMQKYVDSPTIDKNGYRGLSRDTLSPFVVDLKDKRLVKRVFEVCQSLLGKDYSKSEWMCLRNLVFPIYGDDGVLDRILLRSSWKELEPKEIQLIMNPSKETRDFFVDISEKSKTIVIGEAILDAASFREVDATVGILALTGIEKTRRLSDYLLEHRDDFQEKNIILALDDDEAGLEATKKLMDVLDKMDVDYQVFPFPPTIKDANEYLNQDKKGFVHSYQRVLSSFRFNDKVNDKEISKEKHICSSRSLELELGG